MYIYIKKVELFSFVAVNFTSYKFFMAQEQTPALK